jgi:hypothetical protein
MSGLHAKGRIFEGDQPDQCIGLLIADANPQEKEVVR